MRIISDFRDYYDGVQAYGTADDLVWVRKEEKIERNRYHVDHVLSRERIEPYVENCHIDSLHLKAILIRFCGKNYQGLKLVHPSAPDEVVYNIDQFDRYVANNKLKEKKGWKVRRWHGFDAAKTDKWFRTPIKPPKVKETDAQRDCPIRVMLSNQDTIYNAFLSPYNFERVFDPYTAYQEIYMHLSNLAAPEKPIPHIDDKTMVEVKGFHPKFSFRKAPKGK